MAEVALVPACASSSRTDPSKIRSRCFPARPCRPAIARDVAHRYVGTLVVGRSPSGGAVFELTLPDAARGQRRDHRPVAGPARGGVALPPDAAR